MAGWRHLEKNRQSAIFLALLCVVAHPALAQEPAGVPVDSSASDTVSGQKKLFNPHMIEDLRKKMPATPQAAGTGENEDYDNYSGSTPPITASEIDAFRMKIGKCFDNGVLADDPQADKLYADLSFKLAKDGNVIGTPEIDRTGPGNSQLLAILARKSVLQCAPYDMLPRDKYGSWRDVMARFSVAGMQ